MPEFNKQQKAAIDARNPFLLCSAGAGSGKTTVMVESIVSKLAENPQKDISGFLIITFTNEAAANMRRKIQQRLVLDARRGSTYAARGLGSLENASISTIHAFCKSLISSYFYAIEGMPPRFEILEEARLEQLFREAFESALDDICAAKAAEAADEVRLVKELMLCFSQDQLLAMTRSLYNALMGLPDPFGHLDRYIENIGKGTEENPWAREILFAADMDLAGLEDFIAQEKDMLCPLTPPQCEDAAAADEAIIRSLLLSFSGYLTVEEKIEALMQAKNDMPSVTVRKPSPEVRAWNEAFKKLRASVKGSGGVLDKTIRNLQSLASMNHLRDNLKIRRQLEGMAVLLKAIAARFRRLKLEEAGIDYSDMEQMAYELVRREDIREAITENITDIYVDECQDVSAIQYAIINALTGEGVSICRVGDIKQSIYGFRSAAPDLMERDIQSFDDDPAAARRKIFFQENYRSCRGIIACINEVFAASMEKSISQIDYTPQDRLKANADGDYGPVEVILLARDAVGKADGAAPDRAADRTGQDTGAATDPAADRTGQDTGTAMDPAADQAGQDAGTDRAGVSAGDMLEAQCAAAGRRITQMVASGEREYKDIVILVQNARTDAPVMVDHFRRMHIPVLYDGGLTFYGLTEISSFLCLLTVIDNDHTDVELAGALRNVPFNFSDTDLAMIREARPGHSWFYEAFKTCCDRGETDLDRRCAAAMEQIHTWRKQARTTGVSELIWRLMRESGIYAVRGAYPDGKLRQLNLDTLYQRAVDMEKRGVTRLPQFLGEIGKLREAKTADTGDTPAAMGEGDNFVRLMTMHKSKGLEFPVVILMNLQKNLRRSHDSSWMKINVGTDETDHTGMESARGPENRTGPESTPKQADFFSSAPLGVYVPAVSMKNHTRRETYGLEAFKIRNVRDSIAEDTRLLYVAMTRAMQKLILIGHFRDSETALWKEKTRVSRIWKTRSMLDLIMPAVLTHLALPDAGHDALGGGWHVSVEIPAAIEASGKTVSASGLDRIISAVLSEPAAPPESMQGTAYGAGLTGGTAADSSPAGGSLTGGSPAGATLTGSSLTDSAPLKTSVTSLLRGRLAASQQDYAPHEEEETVETKRKDALPGFLLSEIAPRPAFMEEEKADAADVGSITHRFLRLIDLAPFRTLPENAGRDACLQLVDSELKRMEALSIMTKSESAAVYAGGAAAFLGSPLGRRLIFAGTLKREWPFTMQIREDSPTMVQGIVDAAFLEDGRWVLIDYKTDRDTRPEIFVPRHEEQMNWYRTAVERLTLIPVKEMWLFALRAGRSFPVARKETDLG